LVSHKQATYQPLQNQRNDHLCPGNRVKPTFPEPITGIEQIHTIKLLGVTFSDNLSFADFAPHIDNTLCSVSQRFYLLKQLKIRDLNQAALDIVFHSRPQ